MDCVSIVQALLLDAQAKQEQARRNAAHDSKASAPHPTSLGSDLAVRSAERIKALNARDLVRRLSTRCEGGTRSPHDSSLPCAMRTTAGDGCGRMQRRAVQDPEQNIEAAIVKVLMNNLQVLALAAR